MASNADRTPDVQYSWCVARYEELRRDYNMETSIMLLAEDLVEHVRMFDAIDENEQPGS